MEDANINSPIIKQQKLIIIGVVGSLSTAIYKALDNYTIHNLILASDGLTATLAYLVIGSWTGLITSIFYSMFLGKKLIDPAFERIVFNNVEMHRKAFIVGSISSGSTLFFLLGNQLGDPSVMIALTNLIVVYTIFYDIRKKEIHLSKALLLAIALMTIGGIASAFNGSIAITGLGLFYVVIVSNGLDAYSEVMEKEGVKVEGSDSVNFFILRFFWLATTGTAIAIVTSLMRGYSDLLVQTIYKSLVYLPWVIITMFFVFIGIGLRQYLKKAEAVSIVLLLFSPQIIFGYPITLIANLVQPGVFGAIPNDANIWSIRLIGSIFIISGIIISQMTPKSKK
jgi:hypothetical protein